MRLYSGQFRLMASEIIGALVESELLEIPAEALMEAELDVVGVFREYQRMDRQLSQLARDRTTNDGRSAELKEKRLLAKEKNFRMGDDAIEYLVAQMLETFMHSPYVEEVYGEDREIRARITPVIKKYTASRDQELDVEVRSKIKNLEEGSTAWQIEYERAMDRIKRNKGLEGEQLKKGA